MNRDEAIAEGEYYRQQALTGGGSMATGNYYAQMATMYFSYAAVLPSVVSNLPIPADTVKEDQIQPEPSRLRIDFGTLIEPHGRWGTDFNTKFYLFKWIDQQNLPQGSIVYMQSSGTMYDEYIVGSDFLTEVRLRP